MKVPRKEAFLVLAIAVAGACVFLFASFYREAEAVAIARLNEQQLIHANQAARGIEDFLSTLARSLDSLSHMNGVVDATGDGRQVMKAFYEGHLAQITSIIRLDERGVVLDSFPDASIIGEDLSGQKHVGEMLRNHQTVLSDVFRSVEGTDSVALHVPVFRNGEFKGSIGVLVNFRSLAQRYLDVIRIGNTGYAWVISHDGRILYTPEPGLTGHSVFELTRENPSLAAMVREMLRGRQGLAQYTFTSNRDRNAKPTRKYAVYLPVHLANTFWSISVASAEEDVLAGLTTLRNKLALVILFLFLSVMAFSTLGARAWLIVREEEKRTRAEAQLRESLERFRQVADTAGEFIWEVDARGVYTYASPSVEKILGYTPEELVGKMRFFDPVLESTREEVKAAAFELAARRETFRDFPNSNLSKDGRIVELETTGSPMIDAEGNLVGYRGAHTDVTARNLAERELTQHRNLLAHLSRVSMLGELSGSLAHELNQPLTAILSNAQAAQRFLELPEADLGEVREILEDIVNDDRRAGDVIHGLRLLLGKGEVKRQPLNINDVVHEALKLMRNDLAHHGVGVQFEAALNLPPVNADRVELQQVLINLMMNACDAMAGLPVEERDLIIHTSLTSDGRVVVSVGDNGPGMADEALKQIFEPFYTTKSSGLGLGLSICRTIITSHGGTFTASNNETRGATFQFALPVAQVPQPASIS